MKPLFTLIISLFLLYSLKAQERVVSGRLTSDDGSPLPGVNIVIKGSQKGTSTDADGRYSLRVPIGATLVFSFVGMQTREVVVTASNLQPARQPRQDKRRRELSLPRPMPRSLYTDSIGQNEGPGIAVLTDQAPRYKSAQRYIDPSIIRSIKKRGMDYSIRTDQDPVRRTGFSLQFTTSIGIEKINRLPSLQNQFAQGRTDGTGIRWAGADEGEIFSWGPLVRTLEFDGSSYPFDKNGKLVPGGTGNGNTAKTYDALSFFQNAFTNFNEIMVAVPAPHGGTLLFDTEYTSRSGIIPNSSYDKINLSTSLKRLRIGRFAATGSIALNRSSGNLLSRGSNLASIVGSVYRTPVTFDNANALSQSAASINEKSYLLPDGTIRSHAPGMSDNPYGLSNESPDREKLDRIIGSAQLEYSPEGPVKVVLNGSLDRQLNSTLFGIPPGYAGYSVGRLSDRNEKQTFANLMVTTNWLHNFYGSELKLSLSYQTDYSRRELDRIDKFGFTDSESFVISADADSTISLRKNLHRMAHELLLSAYFEHADWLKARFTNRNYFSNTLARRKEPNFFPSGSISVDAARLLGLGIDALKAYATISRSIREAPLLYNNWAYASTSIPVQKYNTFFEGSELFYAGGIAPETERKFETGIELWTGRISAEVGYFNNMTHDFIAPVTSDESGFEMQNVARIKNYGGFISAGIMGYIDHGMLGVNIKWSRQNSVVQQINSSEEWIPLAGFSEAKTVLAAGKPAGAIYGTSYVRNENGDLVIGNDGFPIKDENLKMIGNPIPDWNMSWESYLDWRRLRLSFLFTYSKGGDIWNGTNGILNFLGRSAESANGRNTANFVYEGVNENGTPNTLPVTFYDPARPINENRWVRYGWDGVGEEYIEDASALRLSELSLSYSSKGWRNMTIKHFKVSFVGRNLFLFTKYSGADPASTLFSYTSANGLDLFNLPTTRSYSLQLTINI